MPKETFIKANGYIKMFRSFLDWEWFYKPEMVQVWVYLLLKANHQDGCWQGTEIKKGQCFVGRKKVSSETGLSERTVRTCLNRLKSSNQIATKTTNQGTIITIIKWDDYQRDDTSSDQRYDQQADRTSTNDRPTTDQRPTTNKNEKNDKNVKNIKTYIGVVDAYTKNGELKEALISFVEMRQKMKGFTIRSLELALKKLDTLANTDFEKRDVVNQSVEQSWKSFYPMKETDSRNNSREGLPF